MAQSPVGQATTLDPNARVFIPAVGPGSVDPLSLIFAPFMSNQNVSIYIPGDLEVMTDIQFFSTFLTEDQ